MSMHAISPIAASSTSAPIETSANGKLQERTLKNSFLKEGDSPLRKGAKSTFSHLTDSPHPANDAFARTPALDPPLKGWDCTSCPFTKNPVRHLASLFEKISRLFAQVIHWLNDLMGRLAKTFVNKEKQPILEIPLPPPDFSFLHPKDPAYNVKRLSEMSVANARQSICTESIFKSLPKTNPIRLGFESPVEYQTHLGDQAVAFHGAITALGILGITFGNIAACESSALHQEFSDCVKSMAEVWQEPAGKTIVAACALTFAASVYAHRKGWLGQILHDRSLGLRERQIEALFSSLASELQNQAKTNPKEALVRATKILQNIELIESSLHVDLQLSLEKAKAMREILEKSCGEVLNPDPIPVQAPPQNLAAPASKEPACTS